MNFERTPLAPLRKGSQWVRRCCRVRLPPLCKGRWVGLGRAGGVVFFSGDLKLYRCVYCGCPTGSCRPNRKKQAGNARPYVIDFCSDYARRGDHWSPVVQVLPEATPQSRQAVAAPLTQGSQGVRRKTCTTPTGCETLRFPPMFRYRAPEITVSVAASVRL